MSNSILTETPVNFHSRSLHELRTIWTKDGIPIENARITYSFNDSWNRTLSLISADLTYTGVYTCHVDLLSGGFPTVNASAKIDVFGQSQPTSLVLIRDPVLSYLID